MPKQMVMPPELDGFLEDGWIEEILGVVKSGKEATVYCCRAFPSHGKEYIAAKVYRGRDNRGFKNDSVYQEGRVILSGRARRAVKKKTEFGRSVQTALWTGYEFSTLQTLYGAGADVPQPLASASEAMLEEYIGEGRLPGKPLHSVALEARAAREMFDRLLWNVELMLHLNLIHGDLSPYNVLYANGKAAIIDFPQAVDPRFNPNALALLTRDLANLGEYFEAYGVRFDARRYAERLWQRWELGEV